MKKEKYKKWFNNEFEDIYKRKSTISEDELRDKIGKYIDDSVTNRLLTPKNQKKLVLLAKQLDGLIGGNNYSSQIGEILEDNEVSMSIKKQVLSMLKNLHDAKIIEKEDMDKLTGEICNSIIKYREPDYF